MDWRNWCRLCGNYDAIMKVEPEIEEIAAKLIVVNFNNFLGPATHICSRPEGCGGQH